MLQKFVDDFFSSEEKVSTYNKALQELKRIGFIELLRRFGYPAIIEGGSNPHSMACEAAKSHGFQNAVSHLEFFIELYANKKGAGKIVPTFGAEQLLLKQKSMSQEEINKFKGEK